MALKGDRREDTYNIDFYMTSTAERGGVATLVTMGSGAARDQGVNVVSYGATASGKFPMGILLNDVVDIDLTKYDLNRYKHEVQKGSKVTLLTRGEVVTNMISPHSAAITPGAMAFVGNSGLLQSTVGAGGPTHTPPIGRFMSYKDDDGYAKVEINLPMPRSTDL